MRENKRYVIINIIQVKFNIVHPSQTQRYEYYKDPNTTAGARTIRKST